MACCSTSPDVSPPSGRLGLSTKNEDAMMAFWDSSSRLNSSARKASRAGPAALHCPIHFLVSAASIAVHDIVVTRFQQLLFAFCGLALGETASSPRKKDFKRLSQKSPFQQIGTCRPPPLWPRSGMQTDPCSESSRGPILSPKEAAHAPRNGSVLRGRTCHGGDGDIYWKMRMIQTYYGFLTWKRRRELRARLATGSRN